MNHKHAIETISRIFKLENNHKLGQKYSIEETVRNVIPDMVETLEDEQTFYEVEVTGNKNHYFNIKSQRKVLIVAINSFDAFDEVIIYNLKDPIRVGIYLKEEEVEG